MYDDMRELQFHPFIKNLLDQADKANKYRKEIKDKLNNGEEVEFTNIHFCGLDMEDNSEMITMCGNTKEYKKEGENGEREKG